LSQANERQPRVFLRPIARADGTEFIRLMQRSRRLHEPWISPPRSEVTFAQYLDRALRDDHVGLVICHQQNQQLMGAININNIVRGSFLSASLGYYIGMGYDGQGYMSEALQLAKRYAFNELGLHRLEANIQPNNTRSIALVKANGFEFEGLSPGFLYIDGQWRDHERWTCLDARQSLYRGGLGRWLRRGENT